MKIERVRELGVPETAALLVVGITLLGLGAWLVAQPKSSNGTVALLVLGALFVLAGIIGRVPRLKVGGHELDPGTAIQAGAQLAAARAASAAVEPGASAEDAAKGAQEVTDELMKNPETARKLWEVLESQRARFERPRQNVEVATGPWIPPLSNEFLAEVDALLDEGVPDGADLRELAQARAMARRRLERETKKNDSRNPD